MMATNDDGDGVDGSNIYCCCYENEKMRCDQ